jgi:hypothetical protein
MDNLNAMIRPIVNVVTTADIVCSQKKKITHQRSYLHDQFEKEKQVTKINYIITRIKLESQST